LSKTQLKILTDMNVLLLYSTVKLSKLLRDVLFHYIPRARESIVASCCGATSYGETFPVTVVSCCGATSYGELRDYGNFIAYIE